MTDFIVDPDTLELPITGLCPMGAATRRVLLDAVEARLPVTRVADQHPSVRVGG